MPFIRKISADSAIKAYKRGEYVVIYANGKWTPLSKAVFAIVDRPKIGRGSSRNVTEADEEHMRALWTKGYTYRRIAEETGYSLQTVFRHINKNRDI